MAALEPVYSYRDPGIRLIHKQSPNSREGAGRAGPNRAVRAKLSSATGCYRFCQNRQENQTAEVWGCPPLAVFDPPARGYRAAGRLRRCCTGFELQFVLLPLLFLNALHFQSTKWLFFSLKSYQMENSWQLRRDKIKFRGANKVAN